MSLSLAATFWEFGLFFNIRLKKPKPLVSIKEVLQAPENFNFASFLDFNTSIAVKRAEDFCRKRKAPPNTAVFLYSLLYEDSPLISFVFSRLLLDRGDLKQFLQERLADPPRDEDENLNDFYADSLKEADKKGYEVVSSGNLLTSLSKNDPFFRKILIETDLKTEDVENLTWWWESHERKLEERKKFWEYKNLVRMGSMAKEWSAGYTINLDQYSIDWTDVVRQRGFEEIIGHKKEIDQIERSLSRGEYSNVLMVGDPGSGRGAIIQALTQRILFGESVSELNYKRVVELDLPVLISRCQGKDDIGRVLETVLHEAFSAGNIILIIQDLHNFVGSEHARTGPGTIDISGIITNYLQTPRFKILAVTNFADFHRIVDNSPVAPFFEKVEISQISQNETIMLLELFTPGWEAKYKKFISYPAIKELVSKADRYMPALPFPKKATDLMEEVLISVSQNNEEVLLPRHVAEIISEKTEIPVGQLSGQEKQVLLNLESLLHERIINQEEAIKEVASSLRRARSDISIRKGPMGTFLFLGPTGVGKTETAKALAATYFGDEDRIIRLDLSEYQNPKDIDRLIGTNQEQSFFVNQIRETPFALVLLDEIEKANSNILNLFLRILDEGFMTDGLGRKISFLNTVIIATSNAGYRIILEAIAQNMEMPKIKQKLLNNVFETGTFRPEFINRFDAVVVFKSLTKENLLGIANLLLQKLKKNLIEKGVELVITESLKEKIVELGYDPVFGARQMRRVIQDKVENVLASGLLSGELKRGVKVEIEVPDFMMKIN
ncbi:ATP-dependent Clp protease ATP-binding subunit [Candidatus Parcubacteria bacterium]|nr:ATP-dependent Clp protease ATP-binding subunit [Candidatus Parcubacteria bacterium]